MKKAEFTILSWKDESHEQETPVLFVGDRIRTVKLEVGMTIYGIGDGGAYRLDDLEFANERDEKNGVFTLTLIPLLSNGEDGRAKIGRSPNSFLAVKRADILKEHQELFYPNQQVDGKIVDGTFQPDEKYLVNWFAMFMKYFDILRAHPFREQTAIDREMPQLVRMCIREIGAGAFNDMIRGNYVGKENREETFHEAWNSLFKHDWLYNIDPKLSFPSRVLESTINMSTCFDDAVKTVVFKGGIKLDVSKLID